MTTTAIVLAGAAIICAVVDWWAIARDRRRVEYVAKPAATVVLVAVAATIPGAPEPTRGWFVAALALCLAGDVFLLLPAERWDGFVPGLGSFLLGHVAFSVGFVTRGVAVDRLAIGAVLVALVAVPLAWRFVHALLKADRRELVGPVLAYLVAIAAMATTAFGAGNGLGIAGAWLFVGSDALIAETRFVAERRYAGVAIMVMYHAALAGLVASLV